jgi:hypothetical protein
MIINHHKLQPTCVAAAGLACFGIAYFAEAHPSYQIPCGILAGAIAVALVWYTLWCKWNVKDFENAA